MATNDGFARLLDEYATGLLLFAFTDIESFDGLRLQLPSFGICDEGVRDGTKYPKV